MVFIYSLCLKTGFSNKVSLSTRVAPASFELCFSGSYSFNHTLKQLGMWFGAMVRYYGVQFWVQLLVWVRSRNIRSCVCGCCWGCEKTWSAFGCCLKSNKGCRWWCGVWLGLRYKETAGCMCECGC